MWPGKRQTPSARSRDPGDPPALPVPSREDGGAASCRIGGPQLPRTAVPGSRLPPPPRPRWRVRVLGLPVRETHPRPARAGTCGLGASELATASSPLALQTRRRQDAWRGSPPSRPPALLQQRGSSLPFHPSCLCKPLPNPSRPLSLIIETERPSAALLPPSHRYAPASFSSFRFPLPEPFGLVPESRAELPVSPEHWHVSGRPCPRRPRRPAAELQEHRCALHARRGRLGNPPQHPPRVPWRSRPFLRLLALVFLLRCCFSSYV